MANGKCETLRDGKTIAFTFASLRHIDFLDCDTETSKCFEYECKVPDLVASYKNELQ